MTDFKIGRMVTKGVVGKIKAFFSIQIGPLEIDDMKLIEGDKGPFVSFPSKKIERKTGPDYVNIVRLASSDDGKRTKSAQELYDNVLKAALTEYERRTQETLATSPSAGPEDEDSDLPF